MVQIMADGKWHKVSAQLVTDSKEALEGCDDILPVLPMKDTVYGSADGRKVSALLDRSGILRARRLSHSGWEES